MTLSSRNTIRIVFLCQALATGSMFTRIPDLQAGLGIDEGVLGLCLLGQPVGAILTFLFASRVVEGIGTQKVLMWGIPLAAFSVFLLAAAPSPLFLFLAYAAFGCFFALTNVAMNVEADRVEADTGKRLMTSCHGIWSVGQMTTVTAGAVLRGLDVPATWHFGLIVPIICLASLLFIRPMRGAPARAHTQTGKQRALSLPTIATVLLVGYAIGGAILEGAVRQWSVIFMRDSFTAPEWIDTLTLPCFIGATVLGRMVADRFIVRFGPVRFARSLGLIALVGLAVVVTAQNEIWALVGFFIIGIGICVAFPLSTSAAARLGDRPASENVAALTMTTQITLLGAPALLGWMAANFGIRASYLIIAPVVILAIVLAKHLAPKPIIEAPQPA